jgi:5'-deoxynucleotidase YfbR-like HD superfamily hydrolase
MLIGKPIKMRYVYRFQGCRVYDRESIAEHTAFVSMYAMLISNEMQRGGYAINWRELMTRSVVHDMEEILTGDFPRPYKYSNDKLRAALEEAAPVAFYAVIKDIHTGANAFDINADLLEVWSNAKDDTTEGKIIAIADFLSALSFIVQEVQAGNRSMNGHNWTLREAITGLRKKCGTEFDWVINDAERILMEYAP